MKPKLLLLIALAGLSVSGRSQNESPHEGPQASDRAKRDQAKILELASRHGACADWMESLPDRGMGKFFTVDLEKALIRTNSQPVAMEAWLDDVSDKDGVVTARLTFFPLPVAGSAGNRHALILDLHLELRCSPQQADTFLKPKPDKFAKLGLRFAVVARVESVSRSAPVANTKEDARAEA